MLVMNAVKMTDFMVLRKLRCLYEYILEINIQLNNLVISYISHWIEHGYKFNSSNGKVTKNFISIAA